MNKLITYAGAGLLGLAAAVLPAGRSDAGIIQFTNTGSSIGGVSTVLDDSYNTGSGATPGYDLGVDRLLDTSTNPNSQFFVGYFPLLDGDGNDVAVDFNKSTFANVGDTYTARLGFEDRTGAFFSGPNYIQFDNFNVDNPNGVTDFSYDLSVDTDLDNVRDHFESGLVSELWATPDQKTGTWNQTIYPNFDWRNGDHYGSLTLTAVGGSVIPEPSSAVLMGSLLAAGAAGAGINRLRRRKEQHS